MSPSTPRFRVIFDDDNRRPTQPPNPAYPKGIDLDLSAGRGCLTALPYPAIGGGRWLVECEICGIRVAVIAAGRADDPRSLRVACGPRVE